VFSETTGQCGALEKIRTPNPQIRSLVLYPIELRAQKTPPQNVSLFKGGCNLLRTCCRRIQEQVRQASVV